MKLLSTTATVFVLLLASIAGVGAKTDSSLSAIDSETLVEFERLVTETDRLRKELAIAKAHAAKADAEAEGFRRQITEMKQVMETLGVSSTGDNSKLQQRLLEAVRDLQLLAKGRQVLADQIVKLADAATEFLKNPDATMRATLESALRDSDKAIDVALIGDLSEKSETPATLLDGKVSAIKPEYSVVVLNIGTKQGVKVGMPFMIRRENRVIATVRAVDVRQNFCGAVIQNLKHEKEPIQLGDTARVETQNE